jgi:hypothetical protein
MQVTLQVTIRFVEIAVEEETAGKPQSFISDEHTTHCHHQILWKLLEEVTARRPQSFISDDLKQHCRVR